MQRIVIATRESRLALWQAEHVRALLERRLGIAASLSGITTRGDQILDRTLAKVGGKGLFVKELESALDCGDAHVAVHSLKDVPMNLLDGFELVAVLERENPSDAFVSNRFGDIAALPQGARVGTSSLRRAAQLLALRTDLRIAPLRGNLDTRLAKLDAGGYDAIVLAAAGLMRLGLGHRIRAWIDVDQMIPAAGQGAIGLEISDNVPTLRGPLIALRHDPTWLAVHAERAVARLLGGSCSTPLGAFASFDASGILSLRAVLGDANLAAVLDDNAAGPSPGVRPPIRRASSALVVDVAGAQALGANVANALLEAGGHSYLPATDA